jgi:hypothetical protein
MTTEPERQKPRQLLLLFFLFFAALPLSSSLAFGAIIERRDSHVEGDLNWRICLLHVYFTRFKVRVLYRYRYRYFGALKK